MSIDQIGRYQIVGFLGKGGMGTVYHAYDPDLDRDVALKIITLPPFSQNDEVQQRFKREVRAAGRLNHPHIVTVHDVGLDHDPPYVVMELLTGGALTDLLKRGPLPWPEALTLLRPLGQALAYAHQAGIIHRDVKPGNVLFSGDETPAPDQVGQTRILKLVDFGLVRHLDDAELTQSGVVVGSPAYLSPEQIRGETVDQRTDIFALGIMLFELIAGHNPLNQGSVLPTLYATTSKASLDLSQLAGRAPPATLRLIERATALTQAQRYPTAEALVADLDRCLAAAADEELTQTIIPPVVSSAPVGPLIEKLDKISLTREIKQVLQAMFGEFQQVTIEKEFGQGLSGGRVFQVLPEDAEGHFHLRGVVKVAPLSLIHQEWTAYQTWVANKIPGAARIESAPTLPENSLWGGLRYTLYGEGAHEVQSLYAYYLQASPDDLRWILAERLYKLIGEYGWLDRKLNRAFQMQVGYDSVLPVNLILKSLASPPQDNIFHLAAGQLPPTPPGPGSLVHLAGFVVTEIEPERRQVTLNLPAAPTGVPSNVSINPGQGLPAAAYRVRLVNVEKIKRYQAGQIIDSLTGQVLETRQELLLAEASRALGGAIDLTAKRLIVPPDQSAWSGGFFTSPPPLFLPNPLKAYPNLLNTFTAVNMATIHGDLNLENILVDPETRYINVIDFATTRQDHSLHDLLRLETEVVTKLISATIAETHLPALTIYAVYQQLHQMALDQTEALIFGQLPPALEKTVTMLAAIRRMARACLFNPDDWGEYYRGLVIYLLGALKFKNLDRLPQAPLPKQVAFWAAASLIDFLETPPASLLKVGQVLNDRYQIDSLLGTGGMGTVYRGRDQTLEREVAIKVMHPQFAQQTESRKRFLQEAQAAAKLNDPGIVQVFDFGQEQAILYIVMEFIPGDTLHHMLQNLRQAERWPRLSEALELVRQVCLAVDYIHRQGVLHGDLKPNNIMLKAEPSDSLPYQPILTDLGLARLLYQALMNNGPPLGTPAFMSPEQALGEAVDSRSDIYALGVVLYELVTGQLPFPVRTLHEAMYVHTQQTPAPPRTLQPELPESVEQIILQALAKDPTSRFADAAAMAQALAETLPQAASVSSAPTDLVEVVSLLPAVISRPAPPEIEVSIPDAPAEPTKQTTIGGDAISVGNISGGFVAIGAGAQVVVNQADQTDPLTRFFTTIRQQIETRPVDPDVDKDELIDLIEKIQQELGESDQANINKIKRWLNNLVDLAPDIAQATINALAQPQMHIAPPIRQFVAEMKNKIK